MTESSLSNEHFKEIMDKLNQVIASQHAMLTTQAVMNHRLEQNEKRVMDLTSLVVGTEKIPGLVTEVALIKSSVRELTEDHIKDFSQSITWKWILDKALFPIITAFILWLLFTILPDLVKMTP